ncbi:hypothetical protein B0H10DRAFT_2232494 [Mycena sp. CBHHK59/15]|nr:hypothetical protein B0H10DRAFT_2232494 [Mycena sp. CBHHK59/15]
MCARRVPAELVAFYEHDLAGQSTRLKFDDFVSAPYIITNGIGQGAPSSGGLYQFYNRVVHSAACTALWPSARHISPESAVLVNKGGTMFQDTDMPPFAILPRRLAVGT